MTDESTITEAIVLTEQLRDEVTRSTHNWKVIEHLADALAKHAADAAAGTTAIDRERRDPSR